MSPITLNYLWLRPAENCQRAVKKTEDIIPPFLVQNILENREINRAPDIQLQFWHNPEHFPVNATNVLMKIASSGIKLMDLRSLSDYTREPLYAYQDTAPDALKNQNSLLWRQIDAAKILIMMRSLPEDGQAISSDMDIKGIDVHSPKVQNPLSMYGVLLGAHGTFNRRLGYDCMENQLLGMDDRQKSFFQETYEDTLRMATRAKNPQNGYETLINAFKARVMQLPLNDIACTVGYCFEDEYAS
jgi:hypothetical protein